MRARLSELAELVGGEVVGDEDPVLEGLAALATAGPDDLSFLADAKHASRLAASRAGAVLLDLERPADRPAVRVPDPYQAFLALLDRFHPVAHPDWGLDPRAAIAEGARIGADVRIGPYAVIEAGASIGDRSVIYPGAYVGTSCEVGADCALYPGAVLYPGTRLAPGVIVHAGAVLGADGFGYHPQSDGSFRKIPQVGRVMIERDVEIGANACVDRAMLEETVVGAGTKLDNLVQVGHNCRVGEHNVIAGQAGLSGSVTTGPHVRMGGQAGVADHVSIGAGAALLAQAGVPSDVEAGEQVFGTPAVPRLQAARMHAYGKRLGELFARVARLEESLGTSDEESGTG